MSEASHARKGSARAPSNSGVSLIVSPRCEDEMLLGAIADMRRNRELSQPKLELILVQPMHGAQSAAAIEELLLREDSLRMIWTPHSSEAAALRSGILAASQAFLLCDSLNDRNFTRRALSLLRESNADLVIGQDPASTDNSGFARRLRSWLSWFLPSLRNVALHGPRAFRAATVQPIARECPLGDDFMSELVLRARRDGLDVRVIPASANAPVSGIIPRRGRFSRALRALGRALRLRD